MIIINSSDFIKNPHTIHNQLILLSWKMQKNILQKVLFYLLNCIKLEDSTQNKMTKNEAKYPVETSKDGSKKYSKYRKN